MAPGVGADFVSAPISLVFWSGDGQTSSRSLSNNDLQLRIFRHKDLAVGVVRGTGGLRPARRESGHEREGELKGEMPISHTPTITSAMCDEAGDLYRWPFDPAKGRAP
jgi:hypothetical protein